MLYPWQHNAWQQLWGETTASAQQLPHAWLIHGAEGIGKLAFALYLTRALLCQQTDTAHAACGHCSNCHWLDLGQHPDFRLLAPVLGNAIELDDNPDLASQMASLPQRKGHIQVDQIRPLGQLTHLSAHAGGRRVVLLYTAEALNPSAANALLKTLEEPPEGVYFILLSHHLARVLPTIRSRCRLLSLPAPSHQQALDWLNGRKISHSERWLRFLHGAPLQLAGEDWATLFNQLEDIVQHLSAPKQLNIMDSALRWEKYPLAFWLSVLQKWLLDIAQMQTVGSVRYFVEYETNLQVLASQAQSRVLWTVMDELIEAARWIQHPLSTRLLLEKCLIRYTEIFVTTVRL